MVLNKVDLVAGRCKGLRLISRQRTSLVLSRSTLYPRLREKAWRILRTWSSGDGELCGDRGENAGERGEVEVLRPKPIGHQDLGE